MQLLKMGSLNARLVGPQESNGPVLVLMHGFGAPGTDLVGLAPYIPAPEGVRFVFPEAPIALGPEFGGGRAWWNIDMMALQHAMLTGQLRDLSSEVPEGLASAREKVDELLDWVEENLKPSRIVLGGFSQGAMLSTDVALRSERELAGLCLLSGTLLAEKEWTPLMAARKGLPVFQSHGRADPILPFALAQRLRGLLEDAGLDVQFVEFMGQHEIPAPALQGFVEFLERVWG